MLDRLRRLALLAEGQFTPFDAKTAVGVLRYRPEAVTCVLDSTRAGRTAAECVGFGGTVPVVAGVAEAAALGAGALLVGIAPQGGGLPAAWRPVLLDALARGWDLFSGLHVFLADDAEFARAAARSGARIHDVRRPPAHRPIAAGRAARAPALVALTVGSDCNVGKMTAGLETVRALRARGVRTAFVATGQTGIFIEGRGVAVDAIPADFAAGAIEELVLEAAREAEVVIVEGQGALLHPAYSGVTLSLLHGACPAALVLCHASARDRVRVGGAGDPEYPIPPLAELRDLYERAAAWVRPARTVGLAINTLGLGDAEARAACAASAEATGLPATDPVRFGAGPLADALQARLGRTHASRS